MRLTVEELRCPRAGQGQKQRRIALPTEHELAAAMNHRLQTTPGALGFDALAGGHPPD